MNEEEITRVIQQMLEKNDDIFEQTGNYLYFSKSVAEDISNLLDLYNQAKQELKQEKEKNKKLEEELNKFMSGEVFSANQAKFIEKENKKFQDVMDLMAVDLNDKCLEFGCFYDASDECLRLQKPVRECKECIKEYYFKEARGEDNE